MKVGYVPLKYGLTALTPDENPPIGRDGKPARDNRSENARLAVKILDLLYEEEGGKLMAIHAIDALELARDRILSYQTRISLGVLLPSSDEDLSRTESDR